MTKETIKMSNGTIKYGVNTLKKGTFYKEIDRDGKLKITRSQIYMFKTIEDYLLKNTNLIPVDNQTGKDTRTYIKNKNNGNAITISYHADKFNEEYHLNLIKALNK